MSCAVTRTRSPALCTFPSNTYCTPSSSPTCSVFTPLPLYLEVESRAMTNKLGIGESDYQAFA